MKNLRKWLGIAICTFACVFSLTAVSFGQQAGKAAPATTPGSSPASSAPVAIIRTPKTPKEFFARARKLSDLEAAGVPFHLKATFVASGDTEFTGDGTYEIWWRSKDQWQVDATLKDFRLVEIEREGKLKVWSSSSYVPLRLRQVLNAALVRPTAHVAGSDCPRECGAEWKQGHQKINGLDFTKLTSKYICGIGNPKPILCTLQYYLTPNGIPQIYANASIDTLYNDFLPFQKIEVPRRITVASAGKTWLDISILSVEPLQPDQKMPSEDAAIRKLKAQCGFGFCGDVKSVKMRINYSRLIHDPAVGTGKRIVVVKAALDNKGVVREPYVFVSGGSHLDAIALKHITPGWKLGPIHGIGEPASRDMTFFLYF